MKTAHVLACVLAALWPAIALAAGETVPCPEKKAGQWYRFTRTDLYNKATPQLTRIDSVEGDRLLVMQDQEALVTDRMHNWQKLGDRAASPKYYAGIECPFSLGETRVYKDVEYDRDPARKPRIGWSDKTRARGTFTVTVSPVFESVTVKAGTFQVVKVVSGHAYRATFVAETDKRFGSWDGNVRVVSYYAPAIGMWVKSDATEKVDSVESLRYRDLLELVDYSR